MEVSRTQFLELFTSVCHFHFTEDDRLSETRSQWELLTGCLMTNHQWRLKFSIWNFPLERVSGVLFTERVSKFPKSKLKWKRFSRLTRMVWGGLTFGGTERVTARIQRNSEEIWRTEHRKKTGRHLKRCESRKVTKHRISTVCESRRMCGKFRMQISNSVANLTGSHSAPQVKKSTRKSTRKTIERTTYTRRDHDRKECSKGVQL